MESKEIFKSINDIPFNYSGLAIVGGIEFHYLNGEIHREDGPAMFCKDEMECWYLNNEKHCDCGPAFILYNFRKEVVVKEWWLHGQQVTAMEVFDQLTPEQQGKVVWEINEWK